MVTKNPNQRKNDSPIEEAGIILSGNTLPAPETLQKYETILPGIAEKLADQAVQQTSHRIEMERKLVNSYVWKSLLGLIFGFIVGLTGIGGGLYLTFLGYNVIGIVFSSATLVSLVMSFIYGSQSRRNENISKDGLPEIKDEI
jgi:uncharacterized membrane protein